MNVATLLNADGTVKTTKYTAGGGGGGGTTIVDNFAGLVSLTGMTAGSQAYVTATNNLYFYTGSGWFLIATVQNNAPSAITGVNGNYNLATDGTPTVVTAVSTDPEGFPLTWSYSVTTGSLTNGGGATATVTQSDNIFTITPTTNAAYKGDFGITFTSSDGVSLATSASTFTLFGRYDIEKSLRLNPERSSFLSRTASTGNSKTWTWSGWVKRGPFSVYNAHCVVSAGNTGDATGISIIQFNTDNTLKFYTHPSFLNTTSVFRDPNAWYHIVWSVDSTQAIESNRSKIYINGEQITDFSTETYPALNWESAFNSSGYTEEIGRYSYNNGSPFDGYLSEVNFVEGQALTSSDFGEIDSDYGHWKPKAYSGVYGMSGYYLDFKDSVDLGNDVSGNANDWTPTNLTSIDHMLDSPTNNFAVMNALSKGSNIALYEGNTKHVTPNNGTSLSSIGMGTGKWYAEALHLSGTNFMAGVAVKDINNKNYLGNDAYGWGYYYNGNKYNGGAPVAYAASFTSGDIIGISFDADVGEVIFYKNGVSQGVAYTGLPSDNYFFAMGAQLQNSIANFGQDSSFAGLKSAQGNQDINHMGDFYYPVPSGFLALCTQNLPEPTVIPSEHFNPVLWTGNGSKVETGFSPDLVWYKARDVSNFGGIVDVIRGYDTFLQSYSTNADTAVSGLLTADSTGFTPGSAFSSNSYVAWNWKAGGSAVSNTNGSITSSVSANVSAGFSITSWTATSSAQTVGHGLSAAPEVIIMKNRSTTSNWPVFHTVTGSNKLSYLNLTNQEITPTESAPTSSIFNVGQSSATTGTSGHNMVAYAFHSVDGYSKVGRYIGNGNIDGTFVDCGFKPSYVIIKSITGVSFDWIVYDNARNEENVRDKYLLPNTINAEATYAQMDFVSNGFKFRTSGSNNINTREHMFIAFAETPQKYSNAR